jgi:iron complex transport system substrate-binding protein
MAVFPLTITDGSGQLQVFREPPRRILSLVPSATQTLQALGSSHLLVGRTDYDTATSLAHLPSVGGGLDPNLEAILVLEPDLILGFAGESDTSTPQRLAEVGIQHLSLRLDRMADVRTLVEDLGSLTGQGARAGFLLAEMDSTLTEIRRRVGNSTPKRVAYVLGGSPPWVAGPGTFIDELLTVAGGTNVFSDLGELYGPVSMEEFLVREMDIVLAPQGVNVEFPNLELPLTRVSPALELPGPELGNAAWELARALHPEVFR